MRQSALNLGYIFRYRNFRTFTSPRPVQFACVALDSSGEFIAAGGHDVFEIYLWSIKIGRLLEVDIPCLHMYVCMYVCMLVVIAVWNVTVWCGAEQSSLFLPVVHVMLYRWQLKYIFTEKSTQHIKKQCITEILVRGLYRKS